MEQNAIPDDVRRFILECVPAVPYLEALLLLRTAAEQPWDALRLARRLYMGERAAAQLLRRLHDDRILETVAGLANCYRYRPADPAREQLISRVAATYARRLVEISNLIHARNGMRGGSGID